MDSSPRWRLDRRLLLLLLVGAGAGVLGLIAFIPATALRLLSAMGYWTILATSLGFGWWLWRVWRGTAKEPAWSTSEHRRFLALVVVGGGILLIHESYGFKILMDEIMLLGTSMGMHFDRHPLVAVRGHDLQGAFQLLDGQLDKRPLFQPFLVCTLHDLTGYRPENVFALNTGLAFGLLGLVYAVARRIIHAQAGILAVLLLAGLPLLAQNAVGGGFELLNLVMISGTFLLALVFAERRDAATQTALIFSAALLAQTRYESVLFLIPVGLLILWVWLREGRPILNWGTIVSPLLFVPAALHLKIFSARESSWELASRPGFDRPFSLSYAPENFAHWLNFFFDTSGQHSNSLVLSALGWLSLPFALLATVKILRRIRQATPAQATLAFFTVGFAAHTLLMLVYFWGRFDDTVIRRLSLPLHLWMVFAIGGATAELFVQKRWIWRALVGAAVLGAFAYSLPTMSRRAYSFEYYVGREMEWRRAFMQAHPGKDYLFIDNDALIWITHRVSGTPIRQALEHKDKILFNFQNRTFGAFYVFQRYDIDTATGRETVQKGYDLGPDYQLSTYWERRFTPLTVSRISRVVSIRSGPTTPPVQAPPPWQGLSPAQREKARQDYFENMVKQLP